MSKKIIIRKLTREKLGKYLKKIGWLLSSDTRNGVIANNQGKRTMFYVSEDLIEIRSFDDTIFGSPHSGTFRLCLNDLWLEYVTDSDIRPMVSLVIPKGNTLKGARSFISFYKEEPED